MADLSPTVEDYLKVIWGAGEWTDEPVTTGALSDKLQVSPSTVSEAIKRLTRQGLVDHAPYGSVELTESGTREALRMVRRHRLIETFLAEVLGYGWDEVHAEAEVLEHAVSDHLIERLDELLGHPEWDPHGDPIPTGDGHVPDLPATQLSSAGPGVQGVVARVSDREPEILRHLAGVGISLGSRIEVSARTEAAGTMTIEVDGRRVELGLLAAGAVWVVRA